MISAIIPSFNHADYIKECIEAMLGCESVEEIIVVDDASTDRTYEILSYYSDFKKIKIFKKEKNKGLVDSLMLGLANAKCDYVYICASDDFPISGGVDEAFSYLVNNNLEYGIFGGFNFITVDNKWDIYGKSHNLFFNGKHKLKLSDRYLINHPSPILIQSSIFKKQIVINLFSEEYKFDDFPLFYKLFKNVTVNNFCFKKEIKIVNYRHHGSNTYKNNLKMYRMYAEFYEKTEDNKKYLNFGLANKFILFFLKSLFDKKFSDALNILSETRLSVIIIAFFLFPFFCIEKIIAKWKRYNCGT